MGNQEYEVNAAFNYWQKHRDKVDYICDRIPPPSPERGDENYYVWRFDNFMERHADCAHEPPVYYYGLLEDPEILLKKEKNKEEQPDAGKSYWEKIKKWWEDVTLNPKQLWLGLDKELKERQQNAKQYVKNDRDVMPNITKSYGYKYCLAFGKLLFPYLSKEGQVWITKTLDLLQQYMESGVVDLDWQGMYDESFEEKYQLSDKNKRVLFFTDIELNDTRFQSFAYATHPDAYIEGGIENLPYSDLIKIMITPDITEWADIETLRQAWYTGKKVVNKKLQDILREIMEGLDKINKS